MTSSSPDREPRTEWVPREGDNGRPHPMIDAIALGHKFAGPEWGHTSGNWRDCPQTLCRRVRRAEEAAREARTATRTAVEALRAIAHESAEKFDASMDWSLADKAGAREGALYDVLALLDQLETER